MTIGEDHQKAFLPNSDRLWAVVLLHLLGCLKCSVDPIVSKICSEPAAVMHCSSGVCVRYNSMTPSVKFEQSRLLAC